MGRPPGSKNKPKGEPTPAEAKKRFDAAPKASPSVTPPPPPHPPRSAKDPDAAEKPHKKKRKGRTPPKKVLDFFSEMPLQVAGFGVMLATGPSLANPKAEPVVLCYDPEALAAVHEAFAAWLEDQKWKPGTGWGLIGAYMACLGSSLGPLIADAQIKAEKAAKAESDKRERAAMDAKAQAKAQAEAAAKAQAEAAAKARAEADAAARASAQVPQAPPATAPDAATAATAQTPKLTA